MVKKVFFFFSAFGGKLDVSWNPESQVTQWGGFAYFVSCLNTSGLSDRLVVSGRKRLLRLTSTHLKVGKIQSSLMRIDEFMKRISAIAEQLDFNRVWELIILAAFRKWLRANSAKGLLSELLMLID